MSGSVQSYLLALSALFSIVNPIAMALIFSQVTAERGRDEKRDLARRIALYSAIVMLGALWGGAYILNFFGVSLAALRIGGGLVVATSAWALLQRPEQTEERKQEQASHATGAGDVAFYPLTMPFTTGPGTIAVADRHRLEPAGRRPGCDPLRPGRLGRGADHRGDRPHHLFLGRPPRRPPRAGPGARGDPPLRLPPPLRRRPDHPERRRGVSGFAVGPGVAHSKSG